MDFARVIDAVSTFLSDRSHPLAVIGGVAVAAYGMIRTTLDVDLVTSNSAQADLIEHLESNGVDSEEIRRQFEKHGLRSCMPKSFEEYPDLDFDRNLPTTPADVAALRALRPRARYSDLRDIDLLNPPKGFREREGLRKPFSDWPPFEF